MKNSFQKYILWNDRWKYKFQILLLQYWVFHWSEASFFTYKTRSPVSSTIQVSTKSRLNDFIYRNNYGLFNFRKHVWLGWCKINRNVCECRGRGPLILLTKGLLNFKSGARDWPTKCGSDDKNGPPKHFM